MNLTRVVTFIFFLPSLIWASPPTEKIILEMKKITTPLQTYGGWRDFLKENPALFETVSDHGLATFVGVGDRKVNIDGKDFKIAMGCRAVYIAATPKTIVSIMDEPKYFQALYGLDKTAVVGPQDSGGSYVAHIYKLVPGIEIQDYTLKYNNYWDGKIWLAHAVQVSDEQHFALRENMKMLEPSGSGTIYRELSLFYPLRWWMGMVGGIVQKVTKNELTKLNKEIKCAAEKVQASGMPMNDDIAKNCYKEATQ